MALVTNPLVPSEEVAKSLLDEMLPANQVHLPQFYPPGD
jgi:6-phospho-beta-glucosidase